MRRRMSRGAAPCISTLKHTLPVLLADYHYNTVLFARLCKILQSFV
ncbi:hypothetical protein ABI_03410 [Asticcacaulis biprosthecium C19]|uniref:Uncharacterized protein n=1 Tax=Asticcacaulis biprosthecium C19 TaxID=715226 RepID=F4QJ78_9CAUL|nr:hypothetical protein ABI_03410 [Asticcacaulis biprosthecium C19]